MQRFRRIFYYSLLGLLAGAVWAAHGSPLERFLIAPLIYTCILTDLSFLIIRIPATLMRARRCATHNFRLASGLCPACGYDLRASPSFCPECGQLRQIHTYQHLPLGDRLGLLLAPPLLIALFLTLPV